MMKTVLATNRRRKWKIAALTASAVLLGASMASAWDSETREAVRDMPIVRQTSFHYPPAPWVFVPQLPDYDTTDVFVTNLKDRAGGLTADPGDATSINNIYGCPASFAGATAAPTLSGCVAANAATLGGRASIQARKVADQPRGSEHAPPLYVWGEGSRARQFTAGYPAGPTGRHALAVIRCL